jgi:hypothetical protein
MAYERLLNSAHMNPTHTLLISTHNRWETARQCPGRTPTRQAGLYIDCLAGGPSDWVQASVNAREMTASRRASGSCRHRRS